MRLKVVVAFALSLLMFTTLLPETVTAEHDLACHPPSDAVPTENVSFVYKTIELEYDVVGSMSFKTSRSDAPTVSARAVVTVDRGREAISFVSIAGSATATCDSGQLVKVDLSLQNPVSRELARLSIIPLDPIDGRGSRDARYILEHAGGVLQMDGAILVVSAADGPMP